jgi:hypothetical protein
MTQHYLHRSTAYIEHHEEFPWQVPTELSIPQTVYSEAFHWCRDNIGEPAISRLANELIVFKHEARWMAYGHVFHFKSKTDAAAFKIMWHNV